MKKIKKIKYKLNFMIYDDKHNLINLGYLGNTYYNTPEEAEKDYYTLNYCKDKAKESFYRLIEIIWYTDGTITSREIM